MSSPSGSPFTPQRASSSSSTSTSAVTFERLQSDLNALVALDEEHAKQIEAKVGEMRAVQMGMREYGKELRELKQKVEEKFKGFNAILAGNKSN